MVCCHTVCDTPFQKHGCEKHTDGTASLSSHSCIVYRGRHVLGAAVGFKSLWERVQEAVGGDPPPFLGPNQVGHGHSQLPVQTWANAMVGRSSDLPL